MGHKWMEKKRSVSLSWVDCSWAGSRRWDGSCVTNYCCKFFEGSSSRHGFVTAAGGHSPPTSFCPAVEGYFHLSLSECQVVSLWAWETLRRLVLLWVPLLWSQSFMELQNGFHSFQAFPKHRGDYEQTITCLEGL